MGLIKAASAALSGTMDDIWKEMFVCDSLPMDVLMVRGVSGVSSSCGAHGGFLPRHDEDLREPLVRRQGSQVSMRVRGGARPGSRVTGGD